MVVFLAKEYKNNDATGKTKQFETEKEMLDFLKSAKNNGDLFRGEKPISKLQIKRDAEFLSVAELAAKSAVGIMSGCEGHMEHSIQYIETGYSLGPKPRKTYEYEALAKALKCHVNDIID